MFKLLTRDQFREGVFARDKHKCVLCSEPAQDAHHILERRLWEDGGYYLENGASLCGGCHLWAEMTNVSPEELREKIGIKKFPIPDHFYDDQVYDKWGNVVLPNGYLLKVELFHDESVQKILYGKLHLFTDYIKYPRTYHLPWSGNINSDDRTLPNCSQFEGKQVVVTEKLDGENTSIYRDYIHARSIDSSNHWTRNWVKNFSANWQYNLPEGWRVCAENVYAKHSISYSNLDSYLYGFSIWDELNICLDWKETLEWFQLLSIPPVRTLYLGEFNEKVIKDKLKTLDFSKTEGYVIRTIGSFSYRDFKKNVAKFVRPGHIQTVKHWMHGTNLEINELR